MFMFIPYFCIFSDTIEGISVFLFQLKTKPFFFHQIDEMCSLEEKIAENSHVTSAEG